MIPCLIGRDPRQIENIWQYGYRGAYWRRGPVTMSAIAAIDTALWDIKAKMAGVPLYDMLGSKSREGVPGLRSGSSVHSSGAPILFNTIACMDRRSAVGSDDRQVVLH